MGTNFAVWFKLVACRYNINNTLPRNAHALEPLRYLKLELLLPAGQLSSTPDTRSRKTVFARRMAYTRCGLRQAVIECQSRNLAKRIECYNQRQCLTSTVTEMQTGSSSVILRIASISKSVCDRSCSKCGKLEWNLLFAARVTSLDLPSAWLQ